MARAVEATPTLSAGIGREKSPDAFRRGPPSSDVEPDLPDRLTSGAEVWPTEEQWSFLREADRLDELEPAADVVADARGRVVAGLELPMPSMSFLHLSPR
jgi:hypothetical protein